MSKPFSSNATSSRDIVMQILSDICQSPSPSLQLVVTVLSRKCCQLYVKTFLLQYIYQSRYSHANAVRYMSKPFTFITTSNHDIVMKMLSVICQSLSPPIQLVVTIQSCKCCQIYVKAFHLHYNQQSRIVTKMLSVICQNLSPPIQLLVTIQSCKCCQIYVKALHLHYNQYARYSHENAVSYMSKPFPSNTTSSHDIVMKMLSVICPSLSPPIQLVVTIQSCKCCQIYVKAFHLHYNQQSRYSHANAVRYMSKSFTFTTTSSHGIVTRMLSVICQSLSPPIQLVVKIQSRYSN